MPPFDDTPTINNLDLTAAPEDAGTSVDARPACFHAYGCVPASAEDGARVRHHLRRPTSRCGIASSARSTATRAR